MRELKFRVWSERQKTYDYKHPFNTLGNFYINQNGRIFSDYGNAVTPEIRQKDFVVEQYTGLKDKNGKEIYEGDIVDDGFSRICKIRWSEHYTAFEAVSEDDVYEANIWFIAKYGEVIGNIHENSELIKEKNEA